MFLCCYYVILSDVHIANTTTWRPTYVVMLLEWTRPNQIMTSKFSKYFHPCFVKINITGDKLRLPSWAFHLFIVWQFCNFTCEIISLVLLVKTNKLDSKKNYISFFPFFSVNLRLCVVIKPCRSMVLTNWICTLLTACSILQGKQKLMTLSRK